MSPPIPKLDETPIPGKQVEEDANGNPYPPGHRYMTQTPLDAGDEAKAAQKMQDKIDEEYQRMKLRSMQPEPAEGYEWRVGPNHPLHRIK